jgi:hypothetical protein
VAYVDFTLGLADAVLAEMGVPTIARVMEEMDYSRRDMIVDINRVHHCLLH